MKVTRINHAALNIEGKWPETREFYCEFLGIGTTPRPANIEKMIGGGWLQLPNGQVHLIDAAFDGRAGNPVGPHVSYYVDDIAGAEREVEERGLRTFAMGEGPERVVWLTDPAGNTVELAQDPDLG